MLTLVLRFRQVPGAAFEVHDAQFHVMRLSDRRQLGCIGAGRCPGGAHQLANAHACGQDQPDADTGSLGEAGSRKGGAQVPQLLARQDPVAFHGRASHVPLEHGLQWVAIDQVTGEREAQHLLEVGKQHVGRAQLAFGLHRVEQSDPLTARHFGHGLAAKHREDPALELFSGVLPAVAPTGAFAVRTLARLQVRGSPVVEECLDAQSSLRLVFERVGTGLGFADRACALNPRIDARGAQIPKAPRLRARIGQRLVRVVARGIVGKQPVPLLRAGGRVGQSQVPARAGFAFAQVQAAAVVQRPGLRGSFRVALDHERGQAMELGCPGHGILP